MHEHGLMVALVDKVLAVARTAGAQRVTTVRVWLGALSHLTPEHFQEHYDMAAADTMAAGARLECVCDSDPAHPQADGILLESVDVA
ncbi:MAG: hydrogenase/urease maturation nickel metallochaperone HypA [Planctomycetota bacterium]|jgi:hydrogenase nickel incorporation protein HypA/HybF